MAVKVGFIGVGNMGNPMAGNILKQSFPMIVFDLNPKAMENLVQAGATKAGSAGEVVDNSEIVLTSLPAIDRSHGQRWYRRREARVRPRPRRR